MPEGDQEETTIAFKADLRADDDAMHVLYKEDDGRMLIWGPASVEMVDKENDRITTEALKDALPQLMRRQRLSLEHSDQLVGDIKQAHEFDEPKTVKVDGETIERSDFPTAVLKEDDGVPHDGLYVAGEVWADTKQAEETQKDIENGIIDSYSISGEAIESSTQVKGGELVDDIKSIDLSAVTLCEEGMNQKAKFGVLAKSDQGREALRRLAKEAVQNTMPEDEETEGGVGPDDEDDEADNVSDAFSDEEEKALKSMFESVVKEQLPDGELATKDDVPGDETLREKVEEWTGGEAQTPDVSKEVREAAEVLAEKRGSSVEEILERMPEDEDEVDPDEIEDPDDDDEEELDIDPSEDEDMPDEGKEDEPDLPDEDPLDDGVDEEEEVEVPEDDDEEDDVIESGHDVNLETLKEELPEDLFNSVSDHLSDPAGAKSDDGGDDEVDEDEEEKSDEGDMDEDSVEKADPDANLDGYLEGISGEGVPSVDEDQDLAKSFEGSDGEVEPAGGHADEFYKSVEDTEVPQ